jgi:hypothetical protein
VQDEQFWAERVEQQRPRLQALAYRMLGSLTEAEDAVQEAWLRVSRERLDDDPLPASGTSRSCSRAVHANTLTRIANAER